MSVQAIVNLLQLASFQCVANPVCVHHRTVLFAFSVCTLGLHSLFVLFLCLGDLVAVKVMQAVIDMEEDIKAELNVFQNHAHHPNIVGFHGAFLKRMDLDDDQLWLVMEVYP